MKTQKQPIITVQLDIFKNGAELRGLSPADYKTREKYIQVVNELIKFCRKLVFDPQAILPGYELLTAQGMDHRDCAAIWQKGDIAIPSLVEFREYPAGTASAVGGYAPVRPNRWLDDLGMRGRRGRRR